MYRLISIVESDWRQLHLHTLKSSWLITGLVSMVKSGALRLCYWPPEKRRFRGGSRVGSGFPRVFGRAAVATYHSPRLPLYIFSQKRRPPFPVSAEQDSLVLSGNDRLDIEHFHLGIVI